MRDIKIVSNCADDEESWKVFINKYFINKSFFHLIYHSPWRIDFKSTLNFHNKTVTRKCMVYIALAEKKNPYSSLDKEDEDPIDQAPSNEYNSTLNNSIYNTFTETISFFDRRYFFDLLFIEL